MLDREQIDNWDDTEELCYCPYCGGDGFTWEIDQEENVTKEDCICTLNSGANLSLETYTEFRSISA